MRVRGGEDAGFFYGFWGFFGGAEAEVGWYNALKIMHVIGQLPAADRYYGCCAIVAFSSSPYSRLTDAYAQLYSSIDISHWYCRTAAL